MTTPISFSPGMTSSRRFLLFCRPTFSGITVPGKTTMLRIGRIGIRLGMVNGCPLPDGADDRRGRIPLDDL